jgi:ABC-type proline/glycine betaine transport system permease subunit
VQAALLFPPSYAVIAIVAALAWALLGLRAAILAVVALGFCLLMDLWEEAMETIALVAVSVTISVLIAVPSASSPRAACASRRPCGRSSTSCRRSRPGST